MKMDIKASALNSILKPSYRLEFCMAQELDFSLVESAVAGVRKRFPGMKFIPAKNDRSFFRTNVRIIVPSNQLMALAHERQLTTTELLASFMIAAQQTADNAKLFSKGRSRLFVSESPTRLSSYKVHGKSALPWTGRGDRTFCNLGEIYMPDEVAENVRSIDFRPIRLSGMGGACAAVNFRGRTIINCSRKTREHRFEYFFLEELCAAGLDATVETLGESFFDSTVAYSAL